MLRFQLQLGSLGNKYVHRIMLMVYVWTKSPRKKKRTAKATRSSDSSRPSADYMKQIKMRKRREGRMIKIRIFMSDAKRTRGKRIAELKKRVKESEWQKLFLPLSLARTFSGNASNSNTLHLRIECKRCIGRTQLLIPGNMKCKNRRSMRNKKRTRRRRKFCSWLRDNDTSTFVPFMVMETKDKIRFKRASEMEAADSEQSFTECTPPQERNTMLLFESNPSLTNKNSRQQCCTTSKTFIQFRDLGLDDIIVSPSGFDYVTCTDECPGNNDSVLLHGNKLSLNRSLQALARKIRATLTKNGFRASQKTGLGSQGSGLLIHSQHLHKPHNHWHSHKWIRSKIKQGCRPAETQSLVILHFTHDHRLTTSILPHFLITRCECKGHLP